ncbi:uncharacterized protein [Macrobrachium rosenbergii]|uniref:uncharacterized protein n=1 Tax=Macrobrachium rosenbergii TaxID=79674 RepID=UPI0034D5A2CB
MLANKQPSLSPTGTIAEPDDGFCCGGEGCVELFGISLEGRAVMVLAGLVEEAVVTPLGSAAMSSVASYLLRLSPRLLTAVVTAVQASRPRWLPLEYHWAPLDHDPLLHLLELVGDRLTALSYRCHPLSRELLVHALGAMPRLSTLNLPNSADDNVLAVVGAACFTLTTLCVRGSRGVTDDGLRRLMLRRDAYTRSRWRRLFSRWRNLRTTMTRQQSRYRPLSANSQVPIGESALLVPMDPEQLNPLSATLTHVDLGGTRVTPQGVEWMRSVLPHNAFIDTTHPNQRSVQSEASLEDQMAKLLVPVSP